MQVVNPKCFYSIAGKRNLTGVAIFLKGFLRALDTKGIEHNKESSIRTKLRKRANIKTTATQFFLDPKAESVEMDRKNYFPCHCIIIPTSDLANEFFEILEKKG